MVLCKSHQKGGMISYLAYWPANDSVLQLHVEQRDLWHHGVAESRGMTHRIMVESGLSLCNERQRLGVGRGVGMMGMERGGCVLGALVVVGIGVLEGRLWIGESFILVMKVMANLCCFVQRLVMAVT